MVDGGVLLTGASGLLGTWLLRAVPAGREIVGVVHRRVVPDVATVWADLRDLESVRSAVRRVRPSLVVHGAYARDHDSIVDATRHVADAASEVGAHVLFISTESVFSGDAAGRSEEDAPDPVWDYGRWKAEAEQFVSRQPVPGAIVRLPLIVSIDPEDHVVERIRTSAARGDQTLWFSDEVRQPARAPELAAAIWRIASLDATDRAGAWHLPGPERLSRYEIARRVVDALGLDRDAVGAERTPAGAARPRNLLLSDARARRSIGWSPSSVLC